MTNEERLKDIESSIATLAEALLISMPVTDEYAARQGGPDAKLLKLRKDVQEIERKMRGLRVTSPPLHTGGPRP